MAILTENAKTPADITIADDWCVKLPDGYVYSTYEDEDDDLLLTISTVDEAESWVIKRSNAKVEGVEDLLFYSIRSRMELLVFGQNMTGNKTKEFVLRHESDMCIYCQLHDSFGRENKLQSAVYWLQLVTLKAIYEFEIRFDDAGTQDEYQEKLNRIANSICLKQDKKAPEYTRKFMALNKKLPVTEPQDESIVKMYRQMLENQQGYVNMMRLGLAMNDSVEYALCAISKIETDSFDISEKAWKAAEVFRVSEGSFDPEADREIEIQHCFIREIEHMQTFRTFAWLVGEYCTQKGGSAAKLDKNTVLALGQLAGSRRSSYDETHYTAICGFPDVFTAYIPNGEDCADSDKLPSRIRDNDSDEWRIADLNELRSELEELYPCMQIIVDYLRSSRRNKDMPLRGDHSDILYVWCSLTIAANRAFAVTPDAPMNYCYDDRMSYQEFIDSDSMPEFDADDDYDDYDSDDEDDDYDWEEEQKRLEDERKQQIAEKRKRYEDDCVIVKNIPTFSGKTFVASGIDNDDEVKAFLTDNGAFLRKSVSGKTDYLIVSPEWAGDSKYKAVLEQAAKGHTVEVIFYEDFVKYMGGDTDGEDTSNNLDETNGNSTGVADLDAAADDMDKAVIDNSTDQEFSNIRKEGNRIVFDDAFSVELPSGISFSPETDDAYATLSGFCKKDDDDSIELTIQPLDADKSGALKESLEENKNEHEGECDFLMLYEDKNTEVAVFIQAAVYMLEMECNIVPMIRVGKHSYGFQAQYGRSGFGLGDALKRDIKEICTIFDNIKIKNSRKRIKSEIDKDKLNKIVDMLFGIDKEAASALGEHCSEDTPAIVRDDWVITVPAGYMYSTDEEIVGHRPIVLGLDDGTLDLSAPFDSTVNFSVIMPNEDEFSGEPLDSPSMENIVYNTIYPFGGAFGKGYPTIRKDRDMVITYYEHFGFDDEDGRTVYKYMGSILTRRNIYAFQYFDKNAQSQEEAEMALKELLYTVKTKDEYDNEEAESAANSAKMAELNDQLQSLTSQMQAGLSDMQAWAEREKQRLEEQEQKQAELEKKKQAAKANRNADEESVFMYMTLIIDKANGNDMPDDEFYKCYEEDFPALDEKSLAQLRRKIRAEMQSNPNCYEEAVCELPYDKRYYYSANNMYNTHSYTGDPDEDVETLIMDTVSRWFDSSEISRVRSDVRQLIDDERTNLGESLSSVDEDWKNFYLATSSLYIGLLDDTAETYDPKNKLMVKCGNVIGAVQLATSGIFRMSTKLMNYFPVYWNVTVKEIWEAAKENGIYDQREDKEDGQGESIAQAVYDKAMQRLGIKTATTSTSYSSRASEPAYTRSSYDSTPSPAVSSYSSDNTPKKKEGCYIATAVYGSYDAPEVMTLRRFRDETLKKSFLGRLFIKVYYTLSPPIAEKLKNAHRINSFVKGILDKLVNILNSK